MNGLDWLLVVVVGLYTVSGYWQGFIAGAFATVGLLIGGGFGIWLAPTVLGDAEPTVWVTTGALFIVILCASVGQALLQYVGARARERITWQPVRSLDAIGGAALSAVAVMVVAWALGVAVSNSSMGQISNQVRGSTILGKVNGAMPEGSLKVLSSFNDLMGSTWFPQYLEPFAPERIVDVPGVDTSVVDRFGVQQAASSVIKIHGTNACGKGIEGSSFLYAPDRLMTNAHVVAGVETPEVITEGGPVPATVVYYNEDLDIAVLSFADGDRTPLKFAGQKTAKGISVAVLGYPQDGPYDARAGRVRGTQKLRSPDIYGNGTVVREVLSLRTVVRPGNSGGPVVRADGKVVGLVFAASISDNETGYALSNAQIADAAQQGINSVRPVSTGSCA